MDFIRNPVVVFIEVTRACLLSCRHCRANAIPRRDPRELKLNEMESLADDLLGFDTKPLIIITGGDPLMRNDILDIIDIFKDRDLRLAISFSGTALATEERILEISKSVDSIAISIDGSNSEIHDNFRNVNGTFDTSMKIINYVKNKTNLQINTTLSKHNINDLENMYYLLKENGIRSWDIFFLVPTGRATDALSLDKDEIIYALNFIYDVHSRGDIRIKTTEAPFYNRKKLEGEKKLPVTRDSNGLGVTDGRGTLFISHIGDIYPTGFLPLKGGNVRDANVIDVYRNSEIFRKLKDPSLLKGKCGRCPYKSICGGSRSRAYALSGDYLDEDPACPYEV
ncbi:MAG: radical SAM protein [Thermoplasmata archaeon]